MNAVRDWLIPVGDTGFYVTPNEPVDPWDCARWSGSPICSDPVSVDPEFGYNPMTLNPATSLYVDPESFAPDIFGISTADLVTFTPVTIGVPQVSSNECETCVTFGGTFWFMPIPEYTVCRRRPECNPLPPPPPPPLIPPGSAGFTPANRNDNPACFYSIHIRIPSYLIGSDNLNWNVNDKGWIQGSAGGINAVDSHVQKVTDIAVGGNVTVPLSQFDLPSYQQKTKDFYLIYTKYDGTQESWLLFSHITPIPVWTERGPQILHLPNVELAAVVPFTLDETRAMAQFLPPGRDLLLDECFNLPDFPPIPPPRVPPRECCMCCDSNDNEELLRLIAKRLGVDSYPVEVPKSLIDGVGSGSQSLQSITELSVWQTVQLDGLLGQFPIKIKIKDTDLTQSGNQEKTIRLYNIAEALAELYAVSVKSSVVGDAQLQMSARLAAEAVATHAGVAVTQDYVQAIASYLLPSQSRNRHWS
jgi:hypothetical protein